MLETLRFYADAANWRSKSTGFAAQYDPEPSAVDRDRGARARQALSEAPTRPMVRPPCPECKHWQPQYAVRTEGRRVEFSEAAVICCHAEDMWRDFSCFESV